MQSMLFKMSYNHERPSIATLRSKIIVGKGEYG